jgi:hypothetical protein
MSIAPIVAAYTSAANSAPVKNSDPHEQRRAKVTEEHLEEARKLKQLWVDTAEARERAGVGNQLAFGAHYKIGTQGAVGAFLNGKTPLSLKAARGFADGLGCKVSDFSPRLAEILEPSFETALSAATQAVDQLVPDAATAKKHGVSPRALTLARRFDALADDEHRRIAYSLIDNALRTYERLELAQPPSPQAASRASRAAPPRRSGGR